MDEHKTVGERIAYHRRRRGLTQQVLSGRVGRSAVWLSKIERGELILDKISLLLALARVLKVSPSELIGGVELPPNGGEPLDPPRGVLALSRAVMAPRPPHREAPAAAELLATVERIAHEHWGNGGIESVMAVLPEVIDAGRAAAAQGVPGAWWCLANAFQVAAQIAGRLGETKLGWIAANEAVAAAERSGDELMVASAHRSLALALLHEGWLGEAAGVCSDAADAIAPTDATTPEGWSMWGSLHLTWAVTVARAEDAASGRRLLRAAGTAADRVGPGRDDYHWAFGPANVGAHEVAVALEAGDVVEALRVADTVALEDLTNKGRLTTYLFDVAHAHGLRRDDGSAVAVLLEAERHAPDIVRYSVKPHEIVRVLLGRERRSRTPGLRGLAQRLGVAN